MSDLITRNGNPISAANFMRIVKNILHDGVLDGCTITKSGSTINISAGHLIVCGGLVELDATALTVSASGEVVLVINTANDNPVSVIARTITTPTKQDLTNGGTVYELQLATFTYASGAVGTLKTVVQKTNVPRITYGSAKPANPETGDIHLTPAN